MLIVVTTNIQTPKSGTVCLDVTVMHRSQIESTQSTAEMLTVTFCTQHLMTEPVISLFCTEGNSFKRGCSPDQLKRGLNSAPLCSLNADTPRQRDLYVYSASDCGGYTQRHLLTDTVLFSLIISWKCKTKRSGFILLNYKSVIRLDLEKILGVDHISFFFSS